MTVRARHAMPDDVQAALEGRGLWEAYEARPPYQRNDYLGWIGRAKKPDTRAKRLEQVLDELRSGTTYMRMAWKSGESGSPRRCSKSQE